MAQRTCSIDGCGGRVHARGWCGRHYRAWRNHGDPAAPTRIYGDDLARFWSKVNKDGPLPGNDTLAAGLGPCWLWTGKPVRNGYGRFYVGTQRFVAHRMSYRIAKGNIPLDTEVDHLCRVTACVNPTHLEAVDHVTNVLRGLAPPAVHARKTHCIHGHEFTPENTQTHANHPTWRVCRTCSAMRRRERKRRKRDIALAAPKIPGVSK